MKRSNIDAMICNQEGIAEVTREVLNKIQLAKLNAVLKREKEREKEEKIRSRKRHRCGKRSQDSIMPEISGGGEDCGNTEICLRGRVQKIL